jgi:hypothetical protein
MVVSSMVVRPCVVGGFVSQRNPTRCTANIQIA